MNGEEDKGTSKEKTEENAQEVKGIYTLESETPYLFVPSFSEPIKKSPGRPRSEKSFTSQAPKAVKVSSKEAKFLVTLPPAHIIKDEYGNWTLRCVCGDLTTDGFLVSCDKCGIWQHGICVNLNPHTIPEKYLCEKCGNRPIHCVCEQNLNYRFSILKCSQCGYYSHRRCAGLLYGPMPSGSYICSFCGKSRFTYPKVRIPATIQFENLTFTFSQDNIEKFNPQVLSGPFNDFIMIDIYESTLTRREFCEDLFDRFRTFFFICHPLYGSTKSKKKRANLLNSVINMAEYLCDTLYKINHSLFVTIFDSLLNTAIYKAPTFVTNKEPDPAFEMTENSKFEIQTMPPPQTFPQMPIPAPIEFTENGAVAGSDLTQGQFVMHVSGLLGDIEEFDYDNGVDSAIYQLVGTRFVLDTTHFPDLKIHKIPRSMNGNLVLKLFQVGDKIHCGVFVGRSSLQPSDSTDPLQIKTGENVYLGIDFLPASCEDISKWLSWHPGDLRDPSAHSTGSRPTPEQRETTAAIRFAGEIPKKENKPRKTKAKDDDAVHVKRKPKNKLKVAKDVEISLFDMFDMDDPGPFLFHVGDDIKVVEETARIIAATVPAAGQRGRPRLQGRIRRAFSSPVKQSEAPKIKKKEKSGNESDENDNENENEAEKKEAEEEEDDNEEEEKAKVSISRKAKKEEEKTEESEEQSQDEKEEKIEEKPKEKIHQKVEEKIHQKTEEKPKEKLHKKDEEKVHQKTEEKPKEKTIQPVEEKVDKVEEAVEEKSADENEEKTEEKDEEKTEESVDDKTDDRTETEEEVPGLFSQEFEAKIVSNVSKIKYDGFVVEDSAKTMLNLIGLL